MIDRQFIFEHILLPSGGIRPKSLKKHNVTAEEIYLIVHNLNFVPVCRTCGEPSTLISFPKGFREFCSRACMNASPDVKDKRANTMLSKYGENPWNHPDIENKKKKTSNEKYGVDYARQSEAYLSDLKDKWVLEHGSANFWCTADVNEKRKTTCLEKYGVEFASKTESVVQKRQQTCLDRYGSLSYLGSTDCRQLALATRRSSDAYDRLNDVDWLEEHKDLPSTKIGDDLGVGHSTVLRYFKEHGVARDKRSVSRYELELQEFLSEHGVCFVANDRAILQGKEIDLYIPGHNIGIEIDGVYWHSEQFIGDKFYHRNKSDAAAESGVQIIHVTDFEWRCKNDVVKSRLLSKLGLLPRTGARKCQIVTLQFKEYEEFMNSTHVQGASMASVRLGLKHNDELLACMAFAKPRFNKHYEWELMRYASKNCVVGGASRLFSHFVKVYAPQSVVSYSDRRWNTGTVYERLGMKFLRKTSPNYWYVINGALIHRSAFQKHKLQSKLMYYDDKLTEWENMTANGFTRYWDCGNDVYEWRVS
jgi:hypothetical protein